MNALQKGFHLIPQRLHVGIARTIGLAYLPGFFRRFQARQRDVQLHAPDAGIVAAPPQLSRGLEVTHRFVDEFVVIAPPNQTVTGPTRKAVPASLQGFAEGQRWLLISENINTGKRLRGWLDRNGLKLEPAMQADNFDLIVNLVSLGLGASIVPHRVLALHPNRRPVQRITTDPKFTRELIVVVRRQAQPPPALATFIESILF